MAIRLKGRQALPRSMSTSYQVMIVLASKEYNTSNSGNGASFVQDLYSLQLSPFPNQAFPQPGFNKPSTSFFNSFV